MPGVGQGENRLTFPTHYLVRNALDREWIRFATDDERREGENKWWRRLDFTPQCIVHMNVAQSDWLGYRSLSSRKNQRSRNVTTSH